MATRTTLSLVTALVLGATSVATAQAGTGTRPAQHTARSNVAVSRDSARTIALAQVPNAKVRSEKLQRRQGHLVYAFSLRVPNQTSSRRLYVDANTGEVSTPPATSSASGGATAHRSTSAAHATGAHDSSAHHAPTKKP